MNAIAFTGQLRGRTEAGSGKETLNRNQCNADEFA